MSTATSRQGEPETKLPYVKPSFRTISLVAEEVMAVGCKLPATNGPVGAPGGSCTVPSPCLQFSGVSQPDPRLNEVDATDGAGPAMNPGDVYRHGDGVATRLIADETLLVPFKGTLASLQQIFALSPVAAFVWQRVDGRTALDAILAEVLGAFEVDRERAWADLQELIAGLRDAGLVHRVPRGPGDAPGA